MESFSLGEGHRLELHWTEVVYEQDGRCKLQGAYFCGPVLNNAAKLRDKDSMLLDFFEQYYLVVNNVYIGKLEWSGVTYNTNGTISLNMVYLTHDTQLNIAPKLNNTDYLVIDTKGHEVETHNYNLVYKTYVVNENINLYKFGR